MMNTAVTVHVGIVTFNSIDDIPKCLEALRTQTYPAIKVVILDNASSDHTVDWLRENVHDYNVVLNKCNVGFGRAHNQILRAAQLSPADYYMALNPDVVLSPDYIAELIQTVKSPSIGWGTGKLMMMDHDGNRTGKLYSVGHGLYRNGYAINIGYALPEASAYPEACQVFGAPGAAAIYKSALIQDIAPNGMLFDENMFLYYEDIDVDWRARCAGWQCWYIPTSVAYHRGSNANVELAVEALTNRYLSVVKNAYLFDLITYNFPILLGHILLRLLFTPRLGFQMLHQLMNKLRWGFAKRRAPRISRQTMMEWFRWSQEQPTEQPRSQQERFRHFKKRHFPYMTHSL
jgi:GT2 family glycosyltransferase